MAPNVTVHFWAAADILGAPILEITDEDEFFRGFKLTPDLFSLGGWELTLARRVGFALFDSGAVQPEVFVRFLIHAWSDTDYYFGGSLQKRNQVVVHREEQGEEVFTFGGPGPKSYMDRYRLGIEQLTGTGWNLDLDNGVWRWNETATAGRVLNRVIAEDAAQANPALPDLTKTFTDANDSDGLPWTNDVAGANEYEIPIGESLLTTVYDLEDLSELFTTVNLGTVASPLYQLEAFQTYGEDVTGSSPGVGVGLLREGLNIANDSLTVEGVGIRKATHVIVEGKDGAWATAVGTAWSPGEYIKWGKIEYPRSSNINILERAGLRWIRRQDNGDKQITVEIVPGASEATGYYFPGPGEVLWPGNTVTLDTAEDGSTHTPLDFNNEDELLTGLDLTLGPAGDTATADKKAKSWDIKVRLNWERAGFAGAPDQTSASTGNNPCKCAPDAPHEGHGDPPSVTADDAENGENNIIMSVPITVGASSDDALVAFVYGQNEPSGVNYVKNSASPGTVQAFTKLGEISGLASQGFTQRMSVWGLLNPDTTVASSSVKTTGSASLANAMGVFYLEDVNQSSPWGTPVFEKNLGSTTALTIPTAANQLPINAVMWMASNITGFSAPTPVAGQTQSWATTFDNTPGRGDIAAGGGYGDATPAWNLGASWTWIAGGLAVNGTGTPGDTTQPVGDNGEGTAGDDPSIFAPLGHVHEIGLHSSDGQHVLDATDVEYDPLATGLDATNMQEALDEHIENHPSGGGLGAGSFVTTIGDGSATSIQVTHGLGTEDVTVHLLDLTGADPVEATGDASSITVDDANNVTIVFGSAPALDAYRVLVFSSGGSPAGGFRGVLVQRTTDFVAANSNDANPDFDTEIYDTDGLWVVGSPKIFTVPASYDGKMIQLGAWVGFESGATGYAETKIYRNVTPGSIGTTNDDKLVPGGVAQHTPNAFNTFIAHTTAPFEASSGDTFTIAVKTNNGADAIAYEATSILFGLWVVEPGQGEPGAAGEGVPTGGTAGQVLTKDSGTDFDTSWQTPTGGSSGFHYELLMTGSGPPEPIENGDGTDWLYGLVAD